jgi:hypothetical protein
MSIHSFMPAAPPGVTTIPASEVLDRFRAALVARDIRFIARSLIAWPARTQGTRAYLL